MNDMLETASTVSGLMKSLSNPKRLLILCQLTEGERSVSELARLTDMREPAVSQQLALLRKDGIVNARRDGQNMLYALDRPDIRRLIEFLYATYCEPHCAEGGPLPAKAS